MERKSETRKFSNGVTMEEDLLYKLDKPGKRAYTLPAVDVEEKTHAELLPPATLRKEPPRLPAVSEPELVRHFIKLSQRNLGVDTAFYPLGSCTMKYNPKVTEKIAQLDRFKHAHPYQEEEMTQGLLAVLADMQQLLATITGMDAVSLQPAAGAHGELTSMLMIKAYFADRKEKRGKVLIPDSAHGTNPASCAVAGFTTVELTSDGDGCVDLNDLKKKVDGETAALMITNPNTLGIFDKGIMEISEMLHQHGIFLYLDGANLNALLGVARPGDFGADIMHFNLHKTFSTPHGGGGPGAGPIAVKEKLAPYLPVPVIREDNGRYHLDYERPQSIGKIRGFYGNIEVIIKAYAYIRLLGASGLRAVSENAVLNANYLAHLLKEHYHIPYKKSLLHEFVISAEDKKEKGVRALDIAKRLLDFGVHPPTVYFPLIVSEALMIEPTETESRATLEKFAALMARIATEVEETPQVVQTAPQTTPVKRVDEVKAARELILSWKDHISGGA